MKLINKDELTESIRRKLSDVLTEYQTKLGIENGSTSLSIESEFDERIGEISDTLESILSFQYEDTNPTDKVRHSTIFYTGGNIWCGSCQLPDGTWFCGVLCEHGVIFGSNEAMEKYMDGGDYEGIIRYTDDNDRNLLYTMWKEMIETEKTDVHQQACYCDDWEEELEEARKNGFEY